MEERVGSYVKDKGNNIKPNLNDEAMAERRKQEKKKGQAAPAETEVNSDEAK